MEKEKENQAPSEDMLRRIRNLLIKAEAEGVTQHEAEALTEKAAALMARYGIERALFTLNAPASDSPADFIIDLEEPHAAQKSHLLSGIASAMRCNPIQIRRDSPGIRMHVFAYTSDWERADMLFTSVLVQMTRALHAQSVPPHLKGLKKSAWIRSWMLGYSTAVVLRVRAAEAAAAAVPAPAASGVPSVALVLADRNTVIASRTAAVYPRLRKTRITYTGTGFRQGHEEGQRADIGSSKITSSGSPSLMQ
jgi:uncharacterized protein DUF2786